ncbi:MAG: hypothetical protein RSE18_15290 [Acinetobacter sp.]
MAPNKAFQSWTLDAICLTADVALLNKRPPAEATALIPRLIPEATDLAPETIALPALRATEATPLQKLPNHPIN